MKIKILLFAALILIAVSCGKQAEESSEVSVSPVLETISAGSMARFKEQYQGKVLMVNFFASWCPPCRAETPEFVKVFTEHQDKFAIVGISTDPNEPELAKFIGDFRVNYPIFIADKSLVREYGIATLPTSIIFGPDGKLADVVIGPVSETKMKQYIETLLP
jgi:thiol-disulfide isomerase/thioredoxin